MLNSKKLRVVLILGLMIAFYYCAAATADAFFARDLLKLLIWVCGSSVTGLLALRLIDIDGCEE